MPTVKEIAERSGVSPATVSRVMNGSGSVTAGKRERVLAVLEALGGTRPQRRSGSRSMNIGILLSDSPESDSHAILQKLAFLAGQMQQHWNLLLLPAGILPQELEARHLRGELAGLFLVGHAADSPELIRALRRIPYVWLNSHHSCGTDPTVLMGNEFAGRIAARYLKDTGCSRFLLLSAPSRNPGFPGRIAGFRFELFSHGETCETPSSSGCLRAGPDSKFAPTTKSSRHLTPPFPISKAEPLTAFFRRRNGSPPFCTAGSRAAGRRHAPSSSPATTRRNI